MHRLRYRAPPSGDPSHSLILPVGARRYWLSVGVQPSDTVAKLLGQAGIIPMPARRGPPTVSPKARQGQGFAAAGVAAAPAAAGAAGVQ